MPSVVRDKEVARPEKEKNGQDGQGGARPARRFLTRTTVTRNPSQSPEALSTELLGNSKNLTRFVRTMTNTLNEQESKIEASVATMEENIGQERPELRFILPELKRGLEGQLNKQCSDTKILGIMLGKDKLHSSYPSSTIGWIRRFEKLADKANKAMCKIIEENRCDTVTEPYPPKGRSELGTVAKETMDVSRQKRTQPDAKDGPVPGKKGDQLTADSVPNPSPRKSSGSNNPDKKKKL